MEYHNLGNYIIVKPLFEKLKEAFPGAELVTSLQLSEQFCYPLNLQVRREVRFWQYSVETAKSTISDFIRILGWKVSGIEKCLKSPMLMELSQADLVIDFSGDIYGDNATWNKFLEGNARLIFALMLRKRVAMIIGSPGPFRAYWRQWFAKRILPRLTLVTNREPLSTAMLGYIGIKGANIRSTVCPSVFFPAMPIEQLPQNDDYSHLFSNSKSTIGLILSGWNMPVGPYYRWPREDSEFTSFIDLIRYIRQKTQYRVCLMSHQNATDAQGRLIKGNDHRIIDRLIELLGEEYDGDEVYALSGLYDAAMSKTVIGSFDLLVSGRIHGAVQGLSQGIPTAILNYGHEPRPHKLWGFSLVYGVGDYLADPNDAEEMKSTVQNLILNRDELKKQLATRVQDVKERSDKDFELLRNLVL